MIRDSDFGLEVASYYLDMFVRPVNVTLSEWPEKVPHQSRRAYRPLESPTHVSLSARNWIADLRSVNTLPNEGLDMDATTQKSFRDLANAGFEFGFVLFIGAGVNGGRHRMWPQLVKQLLANALRTCMSDRNTIDGLIEELQTDRWDFYAQASLAKSLLGERYTDILRELVYERIGDTESHAQKVAAFCRLPEVKAVVTYNYDMFIERAYNDLPEGKDLPPKRPMVPIGLSGRDPYGNKRNILPVYHVHGLLASPSELHKTADDPVVLSYDEYTASARDACSWAVATQIYMLRSHSCLFLGTSLTDWNMLRMLEAAHSPTNGPKHWHLTCDMDYDMDLTSSRKEWVDLAIDAKGTLLNTVGIQLLRVDRRHEHVYESLKQIAQDIGELSKQRQNT